MRCMKGVYENTDEASPFRRRPDFDLLHLKKWCSGYTTSESISLPDKSIDTGTAIIGNRHTGATIIQRTVGYAI